MGYGDIRADGYIVHFFYHHQGQGIGNSLMAHTDVLAQQQNIAKLSADVSITA